MNKQLTRTLLIGCLLTSSTLVVADPELNRCLATNNSPDRFEICYGQMRQRAFDQSKAERKARTDNLLQQLEAEQAAEKERLKSGNKSTSSPAPTPTSSAPKPTSSQSATPKTEVKSTAVPVDTPSESIYDEKPKGTRTIFDQPDTEQPKQQPQKTTAPGKTDRGSTILPSDEPKQNGSDSPSVKPSSPIQYY